MFFEEVRQHLLEEAKSSPNLLSDLAGLENYIAESYHNRSFIELLQNADDANATRFKIIKTGEFLFVANNGRIFNQQDLISLCRSASSGKVKGETIGYRGIGFKSVVGFSKEIHVLSGGLEITFSKNRTQSEIPLATRVPLIRIPHSLNLSVKSIIDSVRRDLEAQGYNTIFVFTDLSAFQIESEFASFNHNSLIFLRNINETEISLPDSVLTQINKVKLSDNEYRLTFNSNNNKSDWIISHENSSSIAFSVKEEEVVKLSQETALIHAFLPTEEINGLGVLINGNFSTDPSRRHLIYDGETNKAIELCGDHLIKIFEKNLKDHNKVNINIVNAIIPFIDPRLLKFQNDSFVKRLLVDLKQKELKLFHKLKLCPSWINLEDYCVLVDFSKNYEIDLHHLEIEGFNALAKYLGAKDLELTDIIKNINKSNISVLGCFQLSLKIFNTLLSTTNLSETVIADLEVLFSQGERKSFNQMKSEPFSKLDEPFLSFLLENGLTEFDIKQVMSKFLSVNIVENHFIKVTGEKEILAKPVLANSDLGSQQTTNISTKLDLNIKRWRRSEEITLEILNLNKFQLEDVSKQNIGYDLSGYDPNGNSIYIEVKSITKPGEKFRLTNNEIAVAQDKRKSYFIAVVRQTENTIEVALISDPVNNLVLNRQCVQWIWECENYSYEPIVFEF
jgi:hypothetical protein